MASKDHLHFSCSCQVATADWKNNVELWILLGSASLQQCSLCGTAAFTCSHTPPRVCCGWAEPQCQAKAERDNIYSVPARWTQCFSSLRQQRMHGKTLEFPPGWFDELLLLVWQQWDIISMTGARNAVLQLFPPLLLTIQSTGGGCDNTHKVTDLMMHMGSLLKAMLPGLHYRATWWPGWINFLSTISASTSTWHTSLAIYLSMVSLKKKKNTPKIAHRKAWWRYE